MTYYPTSAISLSYKSFGQIINADDVNNGYDEITAIGNTLGLSPQYSGTWGSGNLDTVTTNWTTVSARIQNLENGIYSINANYVSKLGNSIIVPSAVGIKGLVVKATAGQTANLFETQDSGGATTAAITAAGAVTVTSAIVSGVLQAGTIDGGSA